MKEILRLIRLVTSYKTHLSAGIFFMIIYGFLNVAPAYYLKPIVDTLGSGKTPELKRFILVGLGIVLLFFFKGIAYFCQNYLMNSLGHRLIFDLRTQLFDKIVNQTVSFFNKSTTGDLISRFTTDLTVLTQGIHVSVTGPLRDFPQILILLGLMFQRSWQLFLVTLIIIPPAAYLINKFGLQNKSVTTKRQFKFGELTALLSEVISGIRVIKAFNMEKHESEKFKDESHRLLKYFLHSIRIASYSSPVLEFIAACTCAIVLTYGGYLILQGHITGGDFASFIVSFLMLNDPIKKFNGFALKIQEATAATNRIFEMMDLETDIQEKENAVELPTFTKEIKIKVDEFNYGDKSVIKDLNITLEFGKITALVGASGSGKSTVANLLPRFFDLEEGKGEILVDGFNIKDVTFSSLRRQIAVVTQETILFNESVASNIAYGEKDCTDQKMIDAAKAAYAHDFIENLPNKYNQQIGEKGVTLSGGQRQRLAIARALLKDAPIMILDEATSALDTESEKEVQKAIENLVRNRTTLVIAHRLSTVQNADVIHVMNSGRIVESGTHDELLAKRGEYFKLYQMQFQSNAA